MLSLGFGISKLRKNLVTSHREEREILKLKTFHVKTLDGKEADKGNGSKAERLTSRTKKSSPASLGNTTFSKWIHT